MLRDDGSYDVKVTSIEDKLTDHYNAVQMYLPDKAFHQQRWLHMNMDMRATCHILSMPENAKFTCSYNAV